MNRLKKLFTLQRFRLAVIAFLSSLIIIGSIFAIGTYFYYKWEISKVGRVMHRTAYAIEDAITDQPNRPDFSDILEEYPELSFAIFDNSGARVSQDGNLKITSLAVQDGITSFGDQNAIVSLKNLPNGDKLEIAIAWNHRINRVTEFATGLLILLFPLALLFGFVTYFASKSTFEPLDKLAIQAETLSHDDLSRRLKYEENDEFKDFADSLNNMLERIEESVLSQERFIQDAAHELRTPLTILRGQIETSLLKPRTVKEYQATLRSLLDEAERLSLLSEVLLATATSELDPAPLIELAPIMESYAQRWLPKFASQKVQLEIKSRPAKSKILEVEFSATIDNLLSNALRFSPENSTVKLTLSVNENQVWLECIDQGPGVPEELQKSIFDRLVRAETSRNRELGGFGIGLAVCKKLAKSRSGDLKYIPQDTGSCFRLILPLVPPQENLK